MSHEMSTENRGTVLETMRGTLKGKRSDGHNVRNAFEEPDDFVVGCHGGAVGGTDPCNVVDGDWLE